MHLVTVILGALLFPKVLSALKCYECIEAGTAACTETQRDCPASQQCGATTVRTSAGGMNVDVKVKSCLPSAGCGLSGSMNIGLSRTSAVSTCCSTALCNVQYPTPPASSSSPNGKKCYTCNGKDCSSILSCSGDEDRCISTRVEYGGNEMTMKGCVSKSLCVSSDADSHALPGVSAAVSCCEGDLCNSATSATSAVSFLLLAAPLVSVALFN